MSSDFEIITEYINIYSGSRNTALYANPNGYTISLIESLGKSFKNVFSVKLVGGVLPDVATIRNEPVLILKIKELDYYNMKGNNNALQSGFDILQLDVPVKAGYFINVKRNEQNLPDFHNPLTELSKMTIEITDINGALFNFGSDTIPVNKTLQHLLTFEIKYSVRKNIRNFSNMKF